MKQTNKHVSEQSKRNK